MSTLVVEKVETFRQAVSIEMYSAGVIIRKNFDCGGFCYPSMPGYYVSESSIVTLLKALSVHVSPVYTRVRGEQVKRNYGDCCEGLELEHRTVLYGDGYNHTIMSLMARVDAPQLLSIRIEECWGDSGTNTMEITYSGTFAVEWGADNE